MNRALKRHIERQHVKQQTELVIITILVGFAPIFLGFWIIETLIK